MISNPRKPDIYGSGFDPSEPIKPMDPSDLKEFMQIQREFQAWLKSHEENLKAKK